MEGRIQHYEADQLAATDGDWSVRFIPRLGSRISTVTWEFQNRTVVYCNYSGTTTGPISSSYFQCTLGCIYENCQVFDPYGFRIEGNIYRLYAFRVSDDMVGDYKLTLTFVGKAYNYTAVSTLTRSSSPSLKVSTLACNSPQIERALSSTSAVVLDKQDFDMMNQMQDILREGEDIKGSIEINPGVPEGKVGVYLIRQPRGSSYPQYQPCEFSLNATLLKFTCQPCVEDIGMGILIASSMNSSFSSKQAHESLQDWIMKRLVLWLFQMPNKGVPNAPDKEFAADYRVIPLKVGWSAVVHVGKKVAMFCPLERSASPDGIQCHRLRALHSDSVDTLLPSGFRVEYVEGNKFFHLLKDEAEPTDSGVYGCTVKLRGYPRPVCSDRRLYVVSNIIPVFTFIYKEMVGAEWLKPQDNFEQYTESKVPFLLTSQEAYILCWTEVDTKMTYTLSLNLTREDLNSSLEYPFNLTHTFILREGIHIMRMFKFYRISGEGKVENGGNLTATCSISYENMQESIPEWIFDENDMNGNAELGQVSANSRHIFLFHPTEGDLRFQGSVDKLEEHPVPLGTIVRCTGAKGYPEPSYEWTEIDPTRISSAFLEMSSPGKIFLDSPDALPKSAFQGDRLEIPKDPKYRGMSYLFECMASNKLSGRMYSIRKLLFLTVCLCESRFVTLDLSLIYSPQMVAGISLVDADKERSTLDIFGERYVHLMRQIILGLSQGGELVRISMHPTTILSSSLKEASLYAEATRFGSNLSRISLAEGLVSQSIRPQAIYASKPDACPQKIPVDLEEGFRTALEDIPLSSQRNPFAVVIPQDRWDVGDAVDFMKNIRDNKGKIISVYFEAPTGWALGRPDYPVQLANFSSECRRYSIDDPAGFINRLPLFDAICNVSQPAVIYDESMMVSIFLSHQPNQLFIGENITIFATIRVTPFDIRPVTAWLCLVDSVTAGEINEGKTSLEYLDNACKVHLVKTSPNETEYNCIAFRYFMVLKNEHDNTYLLAYKRGAKPLLSDQEVAIMPIRLNDAHFLKPSLALKHPAEKALDSAEFECVLEMTRIRFQVYLIYKQNVNGTYKKVAEEDSTKAGFSYRNIGRNVTVHLFWPFFPADAADTEIYCVVEKPGMLRESLDRLPSLASDPVYHNLSAFCPMKPTIERLIYSPEMNIVNETTIGSRLTFICEAVMGHEHMHALQMAYVDGSEDLTICSNIGGGEVNTSVPCQFGSWKTGGCGSPEKILTDIHPKAVFVNCTISFHERGRAFIRRIEYTIPVVSLQHFESFVFCETIPTWEVVEESRFLSDPIDNYFPIDPIVTNIDIGYYEWTCEIVAYPEPTNVSWIPVEATPEKFEEGLRGIGFSKRLVKSTRSHAKAISSSDFFPKKFYPRKENTPYRFKLVRPAPYVYQVGTWGTGKLVCYAINYKNRTAVEEANFQYGYGSTNGYWTVSGSITPSSGSVEPDKPWTIQCPIKETNDDNQIIYLHLLAQVTAPSIQPLELPLMRLIVIREENYRTYIVNISTIGWWKATPGKEYRVSMVKDYQRRQAVKIYLPKASIFDTGKYMCRFFVFGGFNDAEVIPGLVVPANKQPPIIGYKTVNRTWEFADSLSKYLTFFENELLMSKCLMWRFQGPFAYSSFTKPLISESTDRNPNMVKIVKDTLQQAEKEIFQHYIYHTVEVSWYLSLNLDYNKYVGCYWTLDTKEERELGQKYGPLKICAPTENLKTNPESSKPLPRNGVIECYDDGEIVQELIFTWEYKFGPLPRPNDLKEIRGIPKSVNSAKLDASSLPLPGFYIYTCKAKAFCGGKEIISEKSVQFVVVGDEKAPAFTTVNISKSLVLLPEKFTVECPSILSERSALTAGSLVWFRIDRQSNTISPYLHESARNLSYHDLINNTVTLNHPNLVAYHFSRDDQGIFAVDIKPSSIEDFGYYGCTTRAIRPVEDMNELALSQISPHPVCIVSNESAVEIELRPDRTGECYLENEVVNITCQAVAYQIFCDKEDEPLGTCIVDTNGKIDVISETSATSWPLHLLSFQILTWKPAKKTIQYAPTSVVITRDHHHASLTCEINPILLNNSYVSEEEWTRIGPKLSRSATRNICVFSSPTNIIINPPPPDQVSETEVAFKIVSGEWIMCMASGNPSPFVTLDAYPLKDGALAEVMHTGLEGIDQWRDFSRAQPDWPSAPMKDENGAMMLVLREINDFPDVTYVGVCRATNRLNGTDKTAHEIFIFQIQDASELTGGSSFNHFLIIACMMALFIFALGTFIHEILTLRYRYRHLKQE
ncbi:hypothetical protein Aperf_G00000062063 [Anoplocephala perfoliata]